MRHFAVVLVFAVLATAEPPIEPQQADSALSSRYGAPAPQYGAPNGGAPAPQYGAPNGGYTHGGAPTPQYGAPNGGSTHGHAPAPQYGAPNGGTSHGGARPNPSSGLGSNSGYEDYNEDSANYEFKYDVEDQQSGVRFGHQESRSEDVAQGEYYVLLPDGRTQHVQYTADEDGYHPKITYMEQEGEGAQGGYR